MTPKLMPTPEIELRLEHAYQLLDMAGGMLCHYDEETQTSVIDPRTEPVYEGMRLLINQIIEILRDPDIPETPKPPTKLSLVE